MDQLVTIPVPDANAELKAVQTEDGKKWASARHVSEALGIDWKTQHRDRKSVV